MKPWLSLRITEEGGFTGISRCGKLTASGLNALDQKQVGLWLTQLQQLAPAPEPIGADYQTVRLQCQHAGSTWEACFNRADLPEAATQLLNKVVLNAIPLGASSLNKSPEKFE